MVRFRPRRERVRVDLGGVEVIVLDGGALGFRTEIAGQPTVIRLAVRPVLVLSGEGSCLIDIGFGHADPGRRNKFELVDPEPLEQQLAGLGLPDGPDVVLLTHLHFDHAAGALARAEDGRERLRFPKSRLLVHEDEWAASFADDRGGGLAPRLERALGRAPELIADRHAAHPAIRVQLVPGHTEGLCVVWVEGSERTCLVPSDLLPTRRFLVSRLDRIADRDPGAALEQRMLVLEEALARESLVAFYHDPAWPLARVVGRLDDGREGFVAEEWKIDD